MTSFFPGGKSKKCGRDRNAGCIGALVDVGVGTLGLPRHQDRIDMLPPASSLLPSSIPETINGSSIPKLLTKQLISGWSATAHFEKLGRVRRVAGIERAASRCPRSHYLVVAFRLNSVTRYMQSNRLGTQYLNPPASIYKRYGGVSSAILRMNTNFTLHDPYKVEKPGLAHRRPICS